MPPPREHHQPHEEDDDDTAGVVKLISTEGFEFVVDKKAAMVSNTLRNMLTSPGRVPFITSSVPSARRPRIASHHIHPSGHPHQAASPRRARARSASRRSPPTSSRRSASISTGRSITPGSYAYFPLSKSSSLFSFQAFTNKTITRLLLLGSPFTVCLTSEICH